MKNQRGKDTGMQDAPTTPTLSDQKKASFPTAENKNVSLSLLLKKANCRSPKRPPSRLPKAVLHFPY